MPINATKATLYIGSISSTAEALALSPASKRLNGKTDINRNLQLLNASHLISTVQNNAQKIGIYKMMILLASSLINLILYNIGKKINNAFSSPKNPIKLIEGQNKNSISVYAGVVVTSSRSSRRR